MKLRQLHQQLNYLKTKPTNPYAGDCFYDSVAGGMQLFNGQSWVVIGQPKDYIPPCPHKAVWYNEHNKVVQCHGCGFVYYGITDVIHITG